MSNKITIPISGMHCNSCELLIEEGVKKVCGVTKVEVDYHAGRANVFYEKQKPSEDDLNIAIKNAGYKIGEKKKLPWLSRDSADYKDLLKSAAVVFMLYVLAGWTGLLDFNVASDPSKLGVGVALVVGLVAGVSSCMALVGGLVLGAAARHAELHPEATAMQKFRPHLFFNLGRIVGYAILGGVIGFIGSAMQLSSGMLGIMTIFVGGVMILLGLKLVEIFPALRNKTISLPSFIAKFFGLHKKHEKEYSHKNSMILGALTFFLPCGFTQAMQLYAVSTGSFTQGALIMFLFALGTSPGLLGIGGLSAAFKGQKARLFFMAAGLAVILLGWFNITNGTRLISNGFTSADTSTVVSDEEAQIVRMDQNANGYSPNVLTVEKGRPVKWIITSKAPYSCAGFIMMPKYKIAKPLKKGENIFTFTPTQTGEIPFSCSMGMYKGKFIVVEKQSSAPSASQSNASLATNGGSCSTGGASGCSGSSAGCGGCGGAAKNTVPVAGVTNIESTPTAVQAQVLQSIYTLDEDIKPNNFTVKQGIPVRLEITVKDNGLGCMSTIMIPGLYNQSIYLEKDQTIVMDFTPEKTGDYPITCAMGVERGLIKVIN